MTIDARAKACEERIRGSIRKAVDDAMGFGTPPGPGLAGMFSPAEPTPIAQYQAEWYHDRSQLNRLVLSGRYAERPPTNRKRKREAAKARRRARMRGSYPGAFRGATSSAVWADEHADFVPYGQLLSAQQWAEEHEWGNSRGGSGVGGA